MRRVRRSRGTPARTLFVLALLGGALASVVWRQTRGNDLQRQIRALGAETAVAESERLLLTTRIQGLQSRARVVRLATERLGMHVAADSEVVFLPLPPESRLGGEEGAP
ncbi:MAG: hypothetical protein M3483_00735 [Gemmatimonadota bacterium]|nr:hypothetical protein [Gemmatimonadota bacterium]